MPITTSNMVLIPTLTICLNLLIYPQQRTILIPQYKSINFVSIESIAFLIRALWVLLFNWQWLMFLMPVILWKDLIMSACEAFNSFVEAKIDSLCLPTAEMLSCCVGFVVVRQMLDIGRWICVSKKKMWFHRSSGYDVACRILIGFIIIKNFVVVS